MEKVIFLTEKQWDNRIKTIVTKNLKKYGRSLSWSSLSYHFKDCVLCTHCNDETVLEIDDGKYKEIRRHVMSEEFCLK